MMIQVNNSREVTKSYIGPKLVFSALGDNDNLPDGCWSYKGKVGSVGGENGQTINLSRYCVNLGTVVHEVMHSLGKYPKSITT